MVIISTFANAQVIHTHWKMSTQKISDCEYDLVFTVAIDKGWHISSAIKPKGAGDEIFPTDFVFKQTAEYSLVGGITESKPKEEFDATLGKKVKLHYNTAVFKQRIKLNTPGKIKVGGTYVYQICDNNVCDFPPKDPFTFELQGSAKCTK